MRHAVFASVAKGHTSTALSNADDLIASYIAGARKEARQKIVDAACEFQNDILTEGGIERLVKTVGEFVAAAPEYHTFFDGHTEIELDGHLAHMDSAIKATDIATQRGAYETFEALLPALIPKKYRTETFERVVEHAEHMLAKVMALPLHH